MAILVCTKCSHRIPTVGYKLCDHCRNVSRKGRSLWRKRNKDKNKSTVKNYRNKIKDIVFTHYGYFCQCCGEPRKEFLTIDHINGGGKKHCREIGGAYALYLWIRKNGFPTYLRTLCINCNFSRGMYGYCPHEKERELEKLGVVIDPEQTKEASEKELPWPSKDLYCPKCSRRIHTWEANVPKCGNCGTEPFEKKP
jgi:hypothetical protein